MTITNIVGWLLLILVMLSPAIILGGILGLWREVISAYVLAIAAMVLIYTAVDMISR